MAITIVNANRDCVLSLGRVIDLAGIEERPIRVTPVATLKTSVPFSTCFDMLCVELIYG
ncbi:hypothetical protein BJV82DRAFT_612708 [Fennellomyces sp. T-0311]|nr:hypothetical protein BJV82DRAFT_612708 [Fennellomyces sp. T-0311]